MIGSRHPGPLRIAMFVLNDMRLDSRVRREASALASAGHRVIVYAVMSDATAHLPREESDGFTIVRVPMLMRPATHDAGASKTGKPSSGVLRRLIATAFIATRPFAGGTLHLAANWRLRWKSWASRVGAEVEAADVWHAHDFNTLQVASACANRLGGMLVYDSHEVFTEAGASSALPAFVKALMVRRERALASRARAVLTVNESVAGVLQSKLGVDVQVVRNCAELPAPGVSPLRTSIKAPATAPIILYHGSVTVGRGIELLIAAFEDDRFRNAHLVIMGYGPLRRMMQSLADRSQARDRLHFLPPVPPREVTRWVAGSDVAAMPIAPNTLNHRLSSPNKLFEAVAAGVPVVAPDFVEFRRVVNDPRYGPLGRLHTAHTPAAIADAIHGILSLSEVDRAALRKRCRAAAEERWNWSIESSRLLDAYNSLLPTPIRLMPSPQPGSAAALESERVLAVTPSSRGRYSH